MIAFLSILQLLGCFGFCRTLFYYGCNVVADMDEMYCGDSHPCEHYGRNTIIGLIISLIVIITAHTIMTMI